VIALDASLLIAHLSPRDAHHAAATTLLRNSAVEPMLAHPLTLAEVLVGAARIGQGEQMLADLEAVGVQLAPPPDGEPLRLARLRANTALKLPDCCALDTALSNGAALATFDAALTRAAQRLKVSVLP
jgi:predicted nucleic acid-binding protein